MGDFIASVSNIENSSWLDSAGPSQLELVVLNWFKGWIGYPAGAAGVLVSGGSAANMTALACAREALLGAMSEQMVAYVSDQAHSSMARPRCGPPIGTWPTGGWTTWPRTRVGVKSRNLSACKPECLYSLVTLNCVFSLCGSSGHPK